MLLNTPCISAGTVRAWNTRADGDGVLGLWPRDQFLVGLVSTSSGPVWVEARTRLGWDRMCSKLDGIDSIHSIN